MTAPITQLLPWVRRGLAAGLTNTDPLTTTPSTTPARAQVSVNVTVQGSGNRSMAIHVLGPGDVTAIERSEFLRSDPQPGAFDVEPNYFASVEIKSADLPWAFTPFAPDDDWLRPWLVLVVVSTSEGTLTEPSEHRPAILRTTTDVLPDLAQSHLWAHSQRTTGGASVVEVARLLCARLLAPAKDYIAAVVPAFEAGRLSGLGLPVPETLAPAWTPGAPAPIDLPVYHSWTFRTGVGGDFEALVARLSHTSSAALAAGVTATVPRLPGSTSGPASGWLGAFPGALGDAPTIKLPQAYRDRLQALVNGATVRSLPVSPPLYGKWLAAAPMLDATTNPAWLWSLNSNPQFRAAAAVGALLVQQRQEDFMAAAWEQIGAVERANALLRQSQVARVSATVMHKRLAAFAPEYLLLAFGPMLSRVLDPRSASRATIISTVRGSRVPAPMVASTFRRLLRPRGPLSRRSGIGAAALLAAVNADVEIIPDRPTPDGLLSLNVHLNRERFVGAADGWMNRGVGGDLVNRKAFVGVLGSLLTSLDKPPKSANRRPALDLPALRDTLVAATRPAVTIPARVKERLTVPPGWSPDDPLEPIMAAPRIDTPLARDLIALAPSLLLPGIADFPDDSVTAMPGNAAFIEALMVGVNHEFSRELLWRGYPTDQRGTAFHRFWDRAATPAGPRDDIDAIDGWTAGLGQNMDTEGAQIVLLVRGQLLRRYPKTLIYATKAEWVTVGNKKVRRPTRTPSSTTERFPAFGGALGPDITYAGFDLPSSVRGGPSTSADAGWFFVFQQADTHLRFGLDVDPPAPAATGSTGWDALNWEQVQTTAAGYFDVPASRPTDITALEWEALTSATLAGHCHQRPFRACIHATDLLGPES